MDSPQPIEETICSREDASADLPAREAVLRARRHESALGIAMCVTSVDRDSLLYRHKCSCSPEYRSPVLF